MQGANGVKLTQMRHERLVGVWYWHWQPAVSARGSNAAHPSSTQAKFTGDIYESDVVSDCQ